MELLLFSFYLPVNCDRTWRRTFNYYRPQTKFAKVMFLHMSVCPRGEVSTPLHAGIHQPPLGRNTPLGRQPLGRHPLGRHPRADTPPGQTPPSTMHGGIGSRSGRYASHLNAILFSIDFHFLKKTSKILIHCIVGKNTASRSDLTI